MQTERQTAILRRTFPTLPGVKVVAAERWTEDEYYYPGRERAVRKITVERVVLDCGNGWGVSAVRGRQGQYARRNEGTWELALVVTNRPATGMPCDLARERDNVPEGSSFARSNASCRDDDEPVQITVDVLGHRNAQEVEKIIREVSSYPHHDER